MSHWYECCAWAQRCTSANIISYRSDTTDWVYGNNPRRTRTSCLGGCLNHQIQPCNEVKKRCWTMCICSNPLITTYNRCSSMFLKKNKVFKISCLWAGRKLSLGIEKQLHGNIFNLNNMMGSGLKCVVQKLIHGTKIIKTVYKKSGTMRDRVLHCFQQGTR